MPNQTEDLTALCQRLEAFETDQWAVDSILRHELMTFHVIDPCVGRGRMSQAARRLGHDVMTLDIMDWGTVFPGCERPDIVADFLTHPQIWPDREVTYFMNPPFSKACQFIDKAKEQDAYKIICFQTWTWRSSDERSAWWAKNPPSRIWLCVDRASCFRFDIPNECAHPGLCSPKKKMRKCLKCMNSTPTTHALFVWERGHTGTTINDLHKAGKKPRKSE